MKRMLSILLVLAMLSSLAVMAFADTWTCPECGEENTGEFCGECGTSVLVASAERSIILSRSDEWFCLKCGTICSKKFCTNCGEKRSEGLEGSFMTFGAYEQDNNTSNGNEPIEWLVLDVQDDKALVISRYGLDAKPHSTERQRIAWETSLIRSWLNSDFLKTAFTAEEQAAISLTNVDNTKQGAYFTDGGINTKDKIFLLSYKEAKKYLHVNVNDSGSTVAQISPTAYAVAQGAYQSSSNKLNGTGYCRWWLRSPGYDSTYASCVFSDGSLGNYYVDNSYGSVRPAFWLNLDSAAIY